MPIASQRGRGDERAALLPGELVPLFDDAFVRSCDLIEEYVARLALAVCRTTGVADACRTGASVDEAIMRAGLAPSVARVPVEWLLRMLVLRHWAEVRAGRYVFAAPSELAPAAIANVQAAHDASALPSYRIAALAAECYPAFLRGETTGEQALFAPERIGAWLEYFSNANPLYAIANTIGALAAERAFPIAGGAILELGGGLGSGAAALLARLEARGRAGSITAYRFTDIVPAFLRRAKKALAAASDRALTLGVLDIDRPFAAAGVAPESCALVYGVNVLHVARNLSATLAEIRTALRPDGALVMSECVRPFPAMPLCV